MAAPKEFDCLLKVIIVGECGAGKTSLIDRFARETFTEPYSHIGSIACDFLCRTVDCLGKRVKLQLWDTAGQERFRWIPLSFYRNTRIVVVAFDLSRPDALPGCESWIEETKISIEKASSSPYYTSCYILVGCKIDLERSVSRQEAEALAASHGMAYFETSSKTGAGVEDMFTGAVQEHQQQHGSRLPLRKTPTAVRLPAQLPQNSTNNTQQCSC